jgi:hypothetical protein
VCVCVCVFVRVCVRARAYVRVCVCGARACAADGLLSRRDAPAIGQCDILRARIPAFTGVGVAAQSL